MYLEISAPTKKRTDHSDNIFIYNFPACLVELPGQLSRLLALSLLSSNTTTLISPSSGHVSMSALSFSVNSLGMLSSISRL